MSQYYPIKKFSEFEFLNTKISNDEYRNVISKMGELLMFKGWIQELESAENYLPNFNHNNPFEN